MSSEAHTRKHQDISVGGDVKEDVSILPDGPLEPTIPNPNPFDNEPIEHDDDEEELYYDEEDEDDTESKIFQSVDKLNERLDLRRKSLVEKMLKKAEEVDELKTQPNPTPDQLKEFAEEHIELEKEDEKPYVSDAAKRAFADTINKVTGERTEKETKDVFTHEGLVDRWKSFLSKFYQVLGQERRYTYYEQILGLRAKVIDKKGNLGSTIVNISYDDLVTTDAVDFNADLIDGIVNDYTANVAALKEAVFLILYDIQPEYAESIKDRIVICVIDTPNHMEIAEISSQNIDKLIHIEGQISQFDNANQIKVIESTWECAMGHLFTTGADVMRKPTKCTYRLEGSWNDKVSVCGQPVVRERVDMQKVVDICYIHINEREIKIADGRFDAPAIDIVFEGTELVKKVMGTIAPAQLVAIDGIVRTRQLSGANHTLRDFEIEGSSFTVLPESVLIEDNPELDEEVRKDIPEWEIAEHFKKLIRSQCPHLEGLYMEKMALLVQQAGADATINIGGGRLRGEINILFVSSPSQGKSEMLQWQQKIRPRSIYVIGRGASAVGLTAGIETVDILKNGQRISTKRIGFGIYPLCNGGVVCLDEIEKRPKEDYESLSHPMDDNQRVVVAKASMYKTIVANCASLHAGNPTKNNGNYDPTKDFFSQINFASWLFSRYDLVFVLQDDNSEARRDRLRNYISDAYTNVRLESDLLEIQEGTKEGTKVEFDPNSDWFPWQYIRREIMYLRETYHPTFKFESDAGFLLWKFWNRYAQINITPNTDPNAPPSDIHFTPAVDKRSIGGLIRISKAVARLFRSNIVELSHMEIAIRLKQSSVESLIPVQTTDQSDQSSLMVKSMTRTVAEQHMKEWKKGFIERQKDLRQQFTQYCMKIHKTYWQECDQCHGSGKKKYLQSEADHHYTYGQCDNCLGTTGQYILTGFTYQDISRRGIPQEVGITPKQSTSFFQTIVLQGWLAPVRGNPGYYRPITNLVEETKKLKRIPIGSELFIDEGAMKEIEKLDQSLKVPKPKSKDDQAIYEDAAADLDRFTEKAGDVV